MTINELQDNVIEEFSVFDDWMDKYALLIDLGNSLPPQEILDADLYFIDKVGLKEHLSPTRSNGLVAMVKQMRLYAMAYRAKEQQ